MTPQNWERRQAFLLGLSDTLMPLNDVAAICEAVAREAAAFLQADGCCYAEIRDGAAIIHGAVRGDFGVTGGTYPLDSLPLLAAAVKAGETLAVSDVRTDPAMGESLRQVCLQLHVLSFLGVPVVRQGQAVGVLCLTGHRRREWTPPETEAATEIAERTWAALERAHAHRAPVTSGEPYRTLLNSSEEGFCIVEVLFGEQGQAYDYRFLEMNPAFVALTGISGGLGQTVRELVPEHEKYWLKVYGEVARTGQPRRFEHLEAAPGHCFDVDVFRIGQPQECRMAALVRDVTHRRERQSNQAFLRQLTTDLGQRANEEDVIHTVGAKLAAHLKLDGYHYVDVDEERQEVTLRHFWHALDVPDILGTYPIGGFIAPALLSRLRAGETVVIHDAQTGLHGDTPAEEGLKAGAAEQRIGAYIAAPYSQDGQWKAYFAVTSRRPRCWTPGETELVEQVAGRVFPIVARIRAEAARRVSEEKYHALFQEMDEGFALCELVRDGTGHVVDYRYLDLNHALVKHGGLTPEALVGKRALEVFPNLDPWLLETYARVVDAHQTVVVEHYYPHVNRWMRLNAFPRGGDHFAVLYSDVTLRKQAEATLRESERRQALLLRLSDALRPLAGPLEIQAEAVRILGHHFGASRSAYAEIETDDEHFVVRSDHAAGVPSCAGRYRLDDFGAAFVQAMREGRTVVIEDGERDPRVNASRRAPYATGMTGAFIGVPLVKEGRLAAVFSLRHQTPHIWSPEQVALAEEVTERIWAAVERAYAEAARRTSELRFWYVANIVPDLLWESEPSGSTNWYNDRWLEYTGQTLEEATGWGWLDAIHPADREHSGKLYREATQAGTSLVQEHRIRRADGTYRWFAVSAAPLKDEGGQVVRMYGAATDIHDLRQMNALLEQRVEERTRRLADLNAELSSVITRTARNLQGPAAYLERLLEPGQAVETASGPSPDPAVLADEVTRLRGMEKDLRELSALERHELELDFISLRELFTEVQERTRGEHRPEWGLGTLPIVRADRALLRQALEVLMTFTLSPTRSAQFVTVESREVEGEVQVTVSDDGAGLSAEEASTLFDLTVRTGQGVPLLEGSGLAQVRRILARLGGWAWAEERLTGGRVVLAFPRDEEVTALERLLDAEA